MRLTTLPSANGQLRTPLPSTASAMVNAQSSPSGPTTPVQRGAASSALLADRDDQELGPQLWYAVFLSGFLVGLLVLGGFWIWFNIRFL